MLNSTCYRAPFVSYLSSPERDIFTLIQSRFKNIKIRTYKTVILPVVLYGCETWSLTVREKHRLRVFEGRVLRKICGPMKDELTREWRRLNNEEFYNLYSSPNIVRVIKSTRMIWAEHVASITTASCAVCGQGFGEET
jgi:hypothetical protein